MSGNLEQLLREIEDVSGKMNAVADVSARVIEEVQARLAAADAGVTVEVPAPLVRRMDVRFGYGRVGSGFELTCRVRGGEVIPLRHAPRDVRAEAAQHLDVVLAAVRDELRAQLAPLIDSARGKEG